jgi:hypothetical protein
LAALVRVLPSSRLPKMLNRFGEFLLGVDHFQQARMSAPENSLPTSFSILV